MKQQPRIVLNPDILVGKPIIRGTRIAVEFIIDLLAQGWSTDEIIRNYPGISLEDIQACLSYASAIVAQKVVTAIALRDDWAGHFSVIEDDKIRMRLL
jgi:uncharacterized protein (DUF433 family)